MTQQDATIKKTLNPKQVSELMSLYQRMETILGGFDQGLSLEKRRRLIHLDRENHLFVRDVADTMRKKPSLCPGYLKAEKVIDDYDFYRQLEELITLHKHAHENLRDIQILLGDRCYRQGLSVYRAVSDAKDNDIPGAKVFFFQLNKRFRTQGRRNAPLLDPVVDVEPETSGDLVEGGEAQPLAEAA